MIRFLLALISSLLLYSTPTQAQNACGMILGGPPIFCETFDTPNPGIPSRTGGLHPNVWGVSRITGITNFGQGQSSEWASTLIQKCDGTTPRVNAPGDIVVCNGQLREASNDNPEGCFDCGTVTAIAMYPKQPFDFAGRTGTVSFDISNDAHGSHSAWPEFWMSDLPVPAPFSHGNGNRNPVPKHGFGIRFHASQVPGGWCVNNADNTFRWTVGSAVIVRNYIIDDSEAGGPLTVTNLDCVIAPPDNSGIMNHVEIRLNQNQIDIYATDAGVAPSPSTLKRIAVITNANLTFTRGLIWLEDVHYNADKGRPPSQREHTFVWDNVAFDGPFTFRDFSYDALDNNTPGKDIGSVNLGKTSSANQASSWNVLNMPANPQAAAVRVLFNFSHQDTPTVLNVIVNGHAHPTPWPYPDTDAFAQRTLAVTIPITDLVPGTNVVQIGSNQMLETSNVNIVLANVPGGVPILPGSNNAYPVVGPTPPPPTPVNGACGTANGVTVNIRPAANLCSVGAPSVVVGTGPWSWTCAGANGGVQASCAAPLSVAATCSSLLAKAQQVCK